MHLYVAGTLYNGIYLGTTYQKCNPVQRAIVEDVPYRLESYHYFNTDKDAQKAREAGIKVFLDSGAFSAFTKGIVVNVAEYCRFCRDNADIIEVASVLDAVGNPLETWGNQQRMEQEGVHALPCFHYGEDTRYLEHYVANYEYITLGGMVPISTRDLFVWLDYLWEHFLTDAAGRPRVKVHGFGMTSIPLMERYPWWSVDSSSWVQFSSFGWVFHPRLGPIQVSEKSPARKQEGRHFDTLSAAEQAVYAREFARVGFTVQELRTSFTARAAYCIWGYCELNRMINTHGMVFINEKQGLFNA